MKIHIEHNPSRGTYWWALREDGGPALTSSSHDTDLRYIFASATRAAKRCDLPIADVDLWIDRLNRETFAQTA